MSDFEPTPDDLLVSAVLDGDASADEAQRVAADPRLAARLAEFRAVAAAVGGSVPLVDTAVREAHLERAMAEARAATPVAGAPPTVAPAPAPPPPPGDLAAARARRDRPRSTTILSIAAAFLLVVAAGAVLVRLGGSVDSGDDSASSTDETLEFSADDSAGESDGGAEGGASPESGDPDGGDTSAEVPASPPSTNADGTASGAIDPALPDLGTFTKAEDLASRVQGELVLESNPGDLAADEGFGVRDTCLDDFGVEVVLLGRATLEGEEGLVYVEPNPGSGRRLWLVDPGTVDADDVCRQITPVQTL